MVRTPEVKLVLPVTVRILPRVTAPEILAVPVTANLASGAVFEMPTLPPEVILTLSLAIKVPLVKKLT